MVSKRDALDKIRTDNMYQFGAILEKVGVLQKTQADVLDVLNKIAELAQEKKAE